MPQEKKNKKLPPSPEEVAGLRRKLAEAEATIESLRKSQVDAESRSLVLLREAQSELIASEMRHKNLLASMSAMVFELEPNGRVVYLNEAVSRLTGYSLEDLMDENFWRVLFPDELSGQVDRLYARFRKGDVRSYELTFRNARGELAIVELNSANRYRADGSLDRITGIGVDITARKQIEEQLNAKLRELQIVDEELRVQNQELIAAQERIQAERQRYRELFDFAPDGYLATDPNGIILEANHAATELLKTSRVALVGRPLAAFITPEERETFHRYVNSLRDRYDNRGWETYLLTGDGRRVPVTLIVGAVRENGRQKTPDRLAGLRWLIHDVSRRKETEAELRRKSETLELLGAIAAAANQAGSIEEALEFALQKVCEFSGFPLGHVYLREEQGPERLVSSGIWAGSDSGRYQAFQEASGRLSFESGAGLPGEVLQKRAPAWRTDIGRDPGFIRAEQARQVGLKAAFAFPVMTGEEVSAVMEFFSDQPGDPDPALMDVMRQVGTQLGRVIERKHAEQALRKSEARFRTIFNNAAIGIVLTDLEGRFLECNPVFQEMTGYASDELRRMTYRDLTHPDDLPVSVERFDALLRGEFDSYRLEKRYLNKHGRPLWIRLAVSVVRSEGDETFFTIGMVENITEQRQMEAELAEVQSRLFDSAEAERLLLAQELHDGPVQDLYGLTFQVESARGAARDDLLRQQLTEIKESLQGVVRALRATAGELRPPTLAPFGLEKAIRSHAERFQEENPGLALHLELEPDGNSLPERTRLALFRIYQQSLTNVLQHARAASVWVRFELDDEQAYLEVQDDGVGFKVPRRWIGLVREGHLGLAGASERAEAIGGRMEVSSEPGQGTLIRVLAPREERVPAAQAGDRY